MSQTPKHETAPLSIRVRAGQSTAGAKQQRFASYCQASETSLHVHLDVFQKTCPIAVEVCMDVIKAPLPLLPAHSPVINHHPLPHRVRKRSLALADLSPFVIV